MHRKLFNFMIVMILFSMPLSLSAASKVRQVPLKPVTQLDLDIVPDLGVRLIFPFVLDSPHYDPPLTKSLTNRDVFEEDTHLQGQNIIVLKVKTPKEGGQIFAERTYLGNFFLSVNGYNVTARLRTTTKLKKHQSDVVFTLDSQAREKLNQRIEQSAIRKLEQDYASKYARLEQEAEDLSIRYIGSVLLEEPKQIKIKEEYPLSLDNGERVVLFLDKMYGFEKYAVLVFELENNSTKIVDLQEAAVSGNNGDGGTTEFIGAMYCKKSPAPGENAKCAYTTQNKSMLNTEKMSFRLETDQGQLVATW